MKKILTIMRDMFAYIAVFIFAVIFVVSIADIACRTFFGFSLLWKLDFLQVAVCWMLAFSMSSVVLTRDHLRIDFLKLILPTKSQNVLTLITDIVELAFFIMLIPNGIKTTVTKMKLSFTTLHWPMGYMYAALPVFASICALFSLYLVFCSVRKIVKGDNTLADS